MSPPRSPLFRRSRNRRALALARGARSLLLLALLGSAACRSLPPPGGALDRDFGGSDVYGQSRVYTAGKDDTLVELARSNRIGFVELVAANPGVDPWVPGKGTKILLPTAHLLPMPAEERKGIVINLAEQRLYAFDEGNEEGASASFPIGVSRDGWKTPLGKTRVVRKKEKPTWTPPASARREDPTLPRIVRPGDDNPLGTHALYLAWPRYLIHGTNEPYGVGRRVSRGCIRLYPEDIIQLYERTPVGTAVQVVDEPVKLAVLEGELFLEVHPTLAQAGELESKARFSPAAPPRLRERVQAFAASRAGPELVERIDWSLVELAGRERRGIPIRVSR